MKTLCPQCEHQISDHTFSFDYSGCDKCNCDLHLGEYVSELTNELAARRSLLKEAGEALKPFAIPDPIGIPDFWMNDFRRAADIVRKIEELG